MIFKRSIANLLIASCHQRRAKSVSVSRDDNVKCSLAATLSPGKDVNPSMRFGGCCIP
jgi:hypothetical protein